MKEQKLSESKIQDILSGEYYGNNKFLVPNVYVFADDWESDLFVLKQNGYSYEFEIKINRSDFFADFKKEKKHSILKSGEYIDRQGEKKTHKLRPNKFFYVVPEGLIDISEVPEYAGLIYVIDCFFLKTIKKAPFIHREKMSFEERLCHRFYAYWMHEINKTYKLKLEIDHLKYKLEKSQ